MNAGMQLLGLLAIAAVAGLGLGWGIWLAAETIDMASSALARRAGRRARDVQLVGLPVVDGLGEYPTKTSFVTPEGGFDLEALLATFSTEPYPDGFVASDRDVARRLMLGEGEPLDPVPETIRPLVSSVVNRLMVAVPVNRWTRRLEAAMVELNVGLGGWA